ncbi:MAG: sodium-translocating pyrophosphatase [Candidatus Harrisonbacteria bacterium RIFCSPLOWO2_01_FULL_40_28]|uniref:K(+)-insensitive pyrophosphate-energized proton pump n=2 Tax=Candidatus Harrisoniibacteriota TaxID=1817905 RepID=A0A1G1ZXM7_9BACT|nr:MAG: sodium-translocating pyrophosphatase [Candidatus Harrisonbacteria bacterium RIFCSPLOWO2_01_FULL_40_28]OGY69259.1 MAG: sodium-translocating pyrophosphatase [Candidatus Harrisonbacteria bacterium RIFOXYD1_FULL_40_9]
MNIVSQFISYTFFTPYGPVVLATLYSGLVMWWLKKQPMGNEKMIAISHAIREGSRAYLYRQNKSVAIVAIILGIALYFSLGPIITLGFLVGALTSALAGYVGMMVAVRSNSKTAKAAEGGLRSALTLAFRAGSVTGFLVVTFSLLFIALLYTLTNDIQSLIGFGFGASLISIFARLGGGIFTKAADVGTDLVGKIEAGIPEDDPRNPGVIADNVGDNVGDCAGMAADLFETYAVTLTAALLLGSLLGLGALWVTFPLVLGGLAIIASIVGTFFVRLSKSQSIMGALYKGMAASLVVAAGLFYFASYIYFSPTNVWNIVALPEAFRAPYSVYEIYGSALIGLLVTVLMVLATDYYTAKRFRPVQSIARASASGHGTNIIMGLSVGLESTALPVIIVGAGMLCSFLLAGLYGVAIAAVSMLSVAGIIIAIDSFGPITDNAGGIAEMSGAPESVRKITDALDAVGNTTKAITKGYAIASAGLAALVLFAGYAEELIRFGKDTVFELTNPYVVIGLFLGAALPYLFSSITMKAVGKTAGAVVEEVRRQFREIPGIMEYKNKPDYGRAVDIVTRAALKEMIIPALLPILFVLLVGFLLGREALGGFLIGSIISGFFVAVSMTAGGAAWDNAKKYIEGGNFGGKGSPAHQAAVTGDTVGDPYKDTAGPAINPLIKVINIVALLMIPFL